MAAQIGPGVGAVDEIPSAEQRRDAYIAALLRERDGYVARGKADRVAAVETELVKAGVELVERATVSEPTERPTLTRKSR